MPRFESLSEEMTRRIESDRQHGTSPKVFCPNTSVIRRAASPRDAGSVWRPAFLHDVDKIMHCPYFNRYTDKTQVFSLIRNDDVTRRSLHVQLVSRIARTIGSALNLNLDLIEAIALGHDIGHPPFAHSGEVFLNEISMQHTGRHFSHNIHSVRVLDGIYPFNISLQTLVGIAGHNGEIELEEYRPVPVDSFAEFDRMMERAYTEDGYANRIQPSTLEGNVVRVADIIAYLGKDRQDAARVKMTAEDAYAEHEIGSLNAEIINNLVVNIIENSYGKPYIKLDTVHFEALRASKAENYKLIYNEAAKAAHLSDTVRPMMQEMYGQLLDDLRENHTTSPIFTHHIAYVTRSYYPRVKPYADCDPNQIVVDYIASMTDDYFIDLHHYLFPNSPYKVVYKGYFDGREDPAHV